MSAPPSLLSYIRPVTANRTALLQLTPMKMAIIGAIVVVLVILLIVYMRKPAAAPAPDTKPTVSKFTGSWTVYTLPGCPACIKQKQILNQLAITQYRLVECKGPECPGITSFPTWVADNGTKRVGMQSSADLKSMGLY